MKQFRRNAAFALCVLIPAVFSACAGKTESDVQQTTAATAARSTAVTAAASAAVSASSLPQNTDIPQFDLCGGFYSAPVVVTLSAKHPVYYTTDGSIPTAESSRYTGPITVSDSSAQPNRVSAHGSLAPEDAEPPYFLPDAPVDKATVITAVSIDENGVRSECAVQTYFIGYDKKSAYYQEMPVISLIADEDSLFSNENGIYVLGQIHENWLHGDDYDSDTPAYSMPANYTQHGKEWERQAAVQFFEYGKLVLSQRAGIRIHGGATRSYPQKSFNLYARKEYGASKLKYDVFAGTVQSKAGGTPITEFDSLILRNGGNDAVYTRFRDKLNQSLVSDRQFLSQGMRPCIVFLNGEFWGQYEITEKQDADCIKAHYGVSKKNVCIIKKDALETGTDADEAEFEALRKWIRETDFSDRTAYEKLCASVDMQSFMDYMSCEIYMNNANWDKSNMAMWRATAADPANPYADEKWRFLMFDTDFSTGIYGRTDASEDSFERIMTKDCFLAELFNGAMENKSFRQRFTETFTEIAEKNFNTERVCAEIDRLEQAYHDAATDTLERFWKAAFEDREAEDSYRKEVQVLRTFYQERNAYIMQYLKQHVPAE